MFIQQANVTSQKERKLKKILFTHTGEKGVVTTSISFINNDQTEDMGSKQQPNNKLKQKTHKNNSINSFNKLTVSQPTVNGNNYTFEIVKNNQSPSPEHLKKATFNSFGFTLNYKNTPTCVLTLLKCYSLNMHCKVLTVFTDINLIKVSC
jgi:hypothetical protein